MALTVKKLTPTLGAEISGIDLSQPLSDETFAEVAAIFFEHEVAVFRDQHLTPGQQIAFTRRFGVLEHHVRRESRLEGHPEILIISNILDGNGRAIGSQDAGRFWHSDLSYRAEPSLLSALYALEIPVRDGQALGDTAFASTTAAYEALPEAMKARLAPLRNVHSYRDYRAKNARAQAEEQARGGRVVEEHTPTEAQLAAVPDIAIPVVRTHPVTKRKGLFASEGHTSHIPGLAREESDRLLGELYRHITDERFVYRHRWRVGDLLMWDNCAVQHKATFDYGLPLRRRLHRTTVRGSAPY